MPAGYKYLITKRAKQDLELLAPNVRERIKAKLLFFINSDNPLYFAERLKERKDGDYRFRVGAYRVVFLKEGNTLYILRVQHRREVYR